MMGQYEFLLFAMAMTVSPILCASFHPSAQLTRISTEHSPLEIFSSRWGAKSILALDHDSVPSRQSVSALFAAKVSVVSVCTAELCNCQEGFTGDDILESLQAKNLPYPIEEAPCLGACGGGAMVAIDFEDGSAALVSGMEETLMELGLDQDDDSMTVTTDAASSEPVVSPSASIPAGNTAPVATSLGDSSSMESESSATSTAVLEAPPSETKTDTEEATKTISTTVAAAKAVSPPKKKKPVVDGYQDARDRMRAQASETEPPSNPWWTAATYLAKKATESITNKGQ